MQKTMNIKLLELLTQYFYKIDEQIRGNKKSKKMININKAKTYEKVVGF